MTSPAHIPSPNVVVTRDDYEVRTALGAPIRRFEGDKALERARKYAWLCRRTFPGCVVEHVVVTVTEERTRVYRPRPVVEDLTVPPIPRAA